MIIGAPVPIEGGGGGGPSGMGSFSGASGSMAGMGMEAASMSSGGGMPLQFDEGVLRQLCDLDVSARNLWGGGLGREGGGVGGRQEREGGRKRERADLLIWFRFQCALPLLTDRIKQSLASCRVSSG